MGKGDYIELDPEELEAVAIESKRTIDIDEFVPKDEIDRFGQSPLRSDTHLLILPRRPY